MKSTGAIRLIHRIHFFDGQGFLDNTQTHNKFSRTIPPVLRVASSAVIQVETEEASDGQIALDSKVTDLQTLDFDPIHPLTGPVYVEGAEPGDVLQVTLHEIELGNRGWAAIVPGFGLLAEDFDQPYLKTFSLSSSEDTVVFNEKIRLMINKDPELARAFDFFSGSRAHFFTPFLCRFAPGFHLAQVGRRQTGQHACRFPFSSSEVK